MSAQSKASYIHLWLGALVTPLFIMSGYLTCRGDLLMLLTGPSITVLWLSLLLRAPPFYTLAQGCGDGRLRVVPRLPDSMPQQPQFLLFVLYIFVRFAAFSRDCLSLRVSVCHRLTIGSSDRGAASSMSQGGSR